MTAPYPAFAGIGGHQSHRSGTEDWLTPPTVLEAVGGADSFDLDPCAPIVRPWATAKRHYTLADNGLILPWLGRVWCNPPYSQSKLGKWLARMADHDHGIALIFARTETDAFFRFIWERASAMLFIRGRLTFHTVDGAPGAGNGGAPSVLCSYGPADADVLAGCGIAGQFVPLRIPRFIVAGALQQSWATCLREWMRSTRGPVRLDDLYRAFASHPKARANPHYREKIRQELQRGPFANLDRGVWALAE